MHAEVLSTRPFPATPGMTIDCSKATENAFQGLLQWIQARPETGFVHIILPPVRSQPGHRQLLTSLQTLGCRVTTRR